MLDIIFVIIGFILLIKGADFLVLGSSNIAKKLHIKEIIIGLTVVSIGTSMPELFVSITSALENHTDLAIGNVIGSNICNLLLILGISTIIRSIKFQKETKLFEIPITLAATIILMIMCNTSNIISKVEGIILLVLLVCFIIYTIVMAKTSSEEDENIDKEELAKISTPKSIISIIIGIIALKFGGDLTVDGCVNIATTIGISEKIISLTIIAIGTSLPELVTSVSAAIKGDSDIAIGNILGSNIFNILFILGTSSILNPINFSVSYNIQLMILIVATIILALFPYIKPKNEMTRNNGIIYLLMYIGYMIMLFV